VGVGRIGVAVGGIAVGVEVAVAAGVQPDTRAISKATNKQMEIERSMAVLLLERLITFKILFTGYNMVVVTCQWFYNS
jgi:hypothetical protein